MRTELERQFILYKQALRLKEIGFDLDCMMCYYGISRDDKFDKLYLHTGFGKVKNSHLVEKEQGITAPLWQQAFEYLLGGYKLSFHIDDLRDDFLLTIKNWSLSDEVTYLEVGCFETYDESQTVCLDVMLYIVENRLFDLNKYKDQILNNYAN